MPFEEALSKVTTHSSEDVLRDGASVPQRQRVFGMLVQITGSLARLEQRVEGVNQRVDGVIDTVNGLERTVAALAVDVRDLVHWKHRVWGMVILMGWLAAGTAAAWAIVGSPISWTSRGPAAETLTAPGAHEEIHAEQHFLAARKLSTDA